MPLFAIVNGARVRATKDGPRNAVCFDCYQLMRAYTGDVLIHHWKHKAENPNCRAGFESEWHLAWKAIVTHDGVEHWSDNGERRTDTLTLYGYAIEYQKSGLSLSDVLTREDDWNHKLIWIFNAKEAFETTRLEIKDHEPWANWVELKWYHAPVRIRVAQCKSLLDIGTDTLILVGEWVNQSQPFHGYGYRVTRKWVEDVVINGSELPTWPTGDKPNWAPSLVMEQELRRELEYKERVRKTIEENRARQKACHASNELTDGGSFQSPYSIPDTRVMDSPQRASQPCKVCGGLVLYTSKWSDCHPVCHQWPNTGKVYGEQSTSPEDHG